MGMREGVPQLRSGEREGVGWSGRSFGAVTKRAEDMCHEGVNECTEGMHARML